MLSHPTRRGFLKASSLSFAFTAAGVSLQLTPAQARVRNVDLQILSIQQVVTLEVVAEAIVPGAKEAGIAYFIDAQLAAKPEDSLLMLRYLGVPPPHRGFYSASLDSIGKAVKEQHQQAIKSLSTKDIEALIDNIAQGKIASWQGPPSEFFYFVLRSDAVDVTYGTEQGFAKLDIPYMAHITPPSPW